MLSPQMLPLSIVEFLERFLSIHNKNWTLLSCLLAVQPSNQSLEGYRHIVSETYCPAIESRAPMFQPETARKKAVAQIAPWSSTFQAYHETLEGTLHISSCSTKVIQEIFIVHRII